MMLMKMILLKVLIENREKITEMKKENKKLNKERLDSSQNMQFEHIQIKSFNENVSFSNIFLLFIVIL